MPTIKEHLHASKLVITPQLWRAYLRPDPSFIDPTDTVMVHRLVRLFSKRPYNDRAGEFHSSSLTGCQRAQIFTFMGMPKDEKPNPTLASIYADGHYRHARWQLTLLQARILTGIEVGVSIAPMRFSGSMDGEHDQQAYTFELKGINPFLYGAIVKNDEPKPEHVVQVHGYLNATGYDRGIVIYENKGTNDFHEIVIRRDERIINDVNAVLHDLNTYVDSKKLPTMLPECVARKGAFERCPYAYICPLAANYESAQAAARTQDPDQAVATLNPPTKRRLVKKPAS